MLSCALSLSLSIWLSLSLSLSLSLWLSLSLSLYFCLTLSLSLSLALSVSLCLSHLSVTLSVTLSLTLSVTLSVALSVTLYLFLCMSLSSFSLCVAPSFCLGEALLTPDAVLEVRSWPLALALVASERVLPDGLPRRLVKARTPYPPERPKNSKQLTQRTLPY